MNYPYFIPGSQGQPEIFVSNISGVLGSYNKPLDTIIQLLVDYSQLPAPPTIASYSFRVSPGGEPQLKIDRITLDVVNCLLRFVIQGGIAGRTYNVTIDVIGPSGGVRSDVLTINVLGDDDGACSVVQPLSLVPPPNVSSDGNVYVNTAPRFFASATVPTGGRPLDQWYNTTTGDIYLCVTNGITSYWTLNIPAGGSAITPISTATIVKLSPITPDGVTTTFTLTAVTDAPVSVVGTQSLFVSVDGVWQEPLTQYVVDTNQITFVEPPSADSKVFMLWFASPTDSTAGADGANIVKLDPITPNGLTTTFIIHAAQPVNVVGSNSLWVSLDGVWQESGVDYVAAGNLVTFTAPVAADARVFMLWFAPPIIREE